MDMYEFRLLLRLSKLHRRILIQNSILALKEFSGPKFLLVGEDSGLKSVWDQICVQVQGEYSQYWSAFENTIENVLDTEFDKQFDDIKELMIYMDGYDNNDSEIENSKENVLLLLKSDLLSKADSYQNETISNYLDNVEDENDEEENDSE